MSAGLLAAVAVLMLGTRFRPRPAVRHVVAGEAPAGACRRARARARAGRRLPRPRLDVRRRVVDPADLAGWCDALARALRAGDTLHAALRAVRPPACVATAVEPAVLALERGASVTAAIGEIDSTSPHLDLVIVVLRACAGSGGMAAEPIDRAAAALRQRAALAAERSTQSAQARLSAVVMTILPGAMLFVLLVTSPAVRRVLLSSPGLFVLTLGAGLNVIGWRWMRRIIGGTP